MATVEENIEAALLGHVISLSTTPAMPVAWPNRAFKPPGGPYLRIEHLPNRNQRQFLKGSSPHYRQGILQLTVVTPLNEVGSESTRLSTRLAGEVAAHFPADLKLTSEDVTVRVQAAPDLAPGRPNDVSWVAPVSVYYDCFA